MKYFVVTVFINVFKDLMLLDARFRRMDVSQKELMKGIGNVLFAREKGLKMVIW